MICPYCHKKVKEVDREENVDYDDFTIDIVYQCDHCGKESVLRLEKDGWYTTDDEPIDEN
jgi:C4-type Zn-finger protein